MSLPEHEAYPCPCCGYRTLVEPPGSYQICKVCFWEDDAVQLRWPTFEGGANRPNLIDSQRAYAEYRAMEVRFTNLVRQPTDSEPRDDGWYPIDADRELFEAWGVHDAVWPKDLTTLYWWRPTFWRSPRIVPPTRHDVSSRWQAVARGDVTREEISRWAEPLMFASYSGQPDILVLQALQYLHGFDMTRRSDDGHMIGHGPPGEYVRTLDQVGE